MLPLRTATHPSAPPCSYVYQRYRGSAALAQLQLADEPLGGPSALQPPAPTPAATAAAAAQAAAAAAAGVVLPPAPPPAESGAGLRDALLYLLACGWEEDPWGTGGVAPPPPPPPSPAGTAPASISGGSNGGSSSSGGPGRSAAAAAPPPRDTCTLRALRSHGFSGATNGAVLAPFAHVVLLFSAQARAEKVGRYRCCCSSAALSPPLDDLQDAYTPLHSASVTLCEAALSDPRGGPAFMEMAKAFFAGGIEWSAWGGKQHSSTFLARRPAAHARGAPLYRF